MDTVPIPSSTPTEEEERLEDRELAGLAKTRSSLLITLVPTKPLPLLLSPRSSESKGTASQARSVRPLSLAAKETASRKLHVNPLETLHVHPSGPHSSHSIFVQIAKR